MPSPYPPLPPDGRQAAPRLRPWLSWCMAIALGAGISLSLSTQVTATEAAGAFSPSHVQPAPATRSVQIGPGLLTYVITQYANQMGVALSFEAAQLGARPSLGLRGSYAVEQGFALLLAGTALQAVRTADRVYTLRGTGGASAATAAELQTVTVHGAAAHSPLTEGAASYASRQITANKGLQSVRDIPQPVTVITRQWMEDQALPDLHGVIQKTPGLTVDYIDSERINYFARGYQIDTLQLDGLHINQITSASTFIQPDTAMLDRVEVLRGATGLLRGDGNPSATVNMVRKRPTSDFQASSALTLGSWNHHRLEADVSSRLNTAGTVRGRVVALGDDKGSFQTARHEKRQSLYGVLEADLSPTTRLTASLQHSALEANGSWGGLPAAMDGSQLNLPRNTYLGTPWNAWNRHNQQAYVELDQRLPNGWTLKAQAAHTRFISDQFKQTSFSSASATNPYLANVHTSIYDGDASTQNALSLYASGPFDALGRQHELALGLDLQRVRTNGATGYWGVGRLNAVDVRTWNPRTSYPEPFYSDGNGTAFVAPQAREQQYGGFVRTQLSLSDTLRAMTGARLSWWRYQEPDMPDSAYGVRHELTPYAALVYDMAERISAYASYSEIFSPQNKKYTDGSLLPPVRGRDLEAGLKGDFLDGKLQGTLSLFRIRYAGAAMDDLRSPMPCLPYYAAGHCYVAGGQSRSQGWEVELSGQMRPGWQLLAGYTATHARTVQDSVAAQMGQPLRSADPRHALRLYTRYQLRGPGKGWTVGGGLRLQSGTYTTMENTTTRQGAYAIFDAMLAYRFNHGYALQLNVNNLFDKVYYAKLSPNSHYFNNYYGEPRNVTLSLRVHF